MNLLCIILLIGIPMAHSDRIVNTNSGPIKGTTLPSKKVEAFLGIPYAEPPVGPLRFARTVSKSPWKEPLEASELPPSCMQPVLDLHFAMESRNMSEDCLFLNIWVPDGGSDSKTMMVFIHGGAYTIGSSNKEIYDGALLSEHGDVIVATINYRLGTLGFFLGLTDDAAGNMGMYDQLIAINWLKNNARHFGGDPDKIVLFGESSGAFSVSLLMVSPLSKNLFKRSILQSGSILNPDYSDDNEVLLTRSHIVASRLGCASNDAEMRQNPKAVVNCMKGLPAEKFSEADLYLMGNYGWMIPRVGDDLLPENPIDLYRKGEFKDDELLVGTVKDEGPLILAFQNAQKFGVYGEKVNPETFDETEAREVLSKVLRMDDNEMSEVVQIYFDRVKNSSRYSYLHAASEAYGDYVINCGAVFQADLQSLHKIPIYFYVFDYRPHSTTLADWMGVAHFEELQYVFGIPMYDSFTAFETALSKDMMDMWVAFAKTGNPNIAKWPLYSARDPKYYVIGHNDAIGFRPDNSRCEAWREVFRMIKTRN